FGQLFGGPVQQADVRIGALDDVAVELEHQAQHAVRGRVLGAEVQSVVLDFCHDLTPQAVRIFTHGARGDFARVDGDRLVDDAPLFGVVAHFDRARQGEVFAERVADEAVVGEDATQVGVAFEDDAEQVESFALEPVDAGPAVDQRAHHGEV